MWSLHQCDETSLSTCHSRLSDIMWLLWAWLRGSEMSYLHKELWLCKILFRKELDKVDGVFCLKRHHNNYYYFEVQQQLFTSTDRKHCDFVVCAISLTERIHPGLWYCSPKARSFLESLYPPWDSGTKTLYCSYCSRLPQFKQRRGYSSSAKQSAQVSLNQAALQLNSICVCASKASPTDRLIECHSPECSNRKFFHLACLGFKRMPNNSKTTWQCSACKKTKQQTKVTTCISYVSAPTKFTSDYCVIDSDDDVCHNDDDDVSITQVTVGVVDKQSALAKLDDSDYQTILSPTGWLTGDIIQQAQVLLQKENWAIEGFQRPTLGPARNFNVVSGEFVQILHTGSNHWVCVSLISCLPGHVNLYDSLYHDAISQEVDQTNDLLSGRLASLKFVSVQQQTNGSDCGVFAIAIATGLAFGTNPSHVHLTCKECVHNSMFLTLINSV